MSVGFDAATEFPTTQSAGVSNTLTLSWNHIPVTSTPQGVGLFVTYSPSSLTEVTEVKYGGVALTRRALARDTATEPGVMEFWYLGAGVPTGTQAFNVVKGLTGSGTWGVGFTVSATRSTTVAQTLLVQENTSLAERTLSTIQVGVRFAGAYYGGAAPPGAGANSTILFDIDYGAYAARVVRETTAGSGKRVVGFAAGTADDVAAIYVAIDEEPVAGTTVSISSKTSDLAFGTVSLISRLTAFPVGLATTANFGQPAIYYTQTLSLTGKSTDATFGSASLFQKIILYPTGLASNEAFGTLTIQPGPTTAYPSSFDGSLSSTFNQAGGFLVWKPQVTATYTVTATVPAGYKFTELASPDISATANIGYNYSPPLVSGDLVVYRQWTTTNGVTTSHSVTISPTGFITIDGGPSDSYSLSFIYFFWDDSANAYGSTLTYTMQTMGGAAQTAYPVGKASDEAFGQANLTSRTTVYPASKATDEAFGQVSLVARTTVYSIGKDSDASFGTASLTSRFIIYPLSKDTDAAFGAASLVQRNTISVIGKESDAAFGQASLSTRATVFPVGKETDAAFGTANVGSFFYITPTGKASDAAFGQASLSTRTFLYPVSKDTDFSLGQVSLQSRLIVNVSGKATDEAFGSLSAVNRNALYLVGLGTNEAFGQAALSQRTFIYPTGKGSDAAFGTPALSLGRYINPASLDSNVAFGVPTLSSRAFIYPSGLGSDASFGQYQFGTRAFVYPASYVQVEAFGIPSIGNRNTFYPSSLASSFAAGTFALNYDQTVYLNGLYQTQFGQFRIYIAGQLIVAGNNIFQWFDAQPDLKGSRIDRLRQYLQTLGYEGQTNEILFSWLGSLGYTETMAERISKFEREFTNRYGPQ